MWDAQFIWLHYNNKYFELMDTVFMILRKKFDQVSFLHVYHHTLLIWAWYVHRLLTICSLSLYALSTYYIKAGWPYAYITN